MQSIEAYEDILVAGSLSDQRSWFVAQTTPGLGAIAEVHLSRQGFAATRFRVPGGEVFPGYIFINFSLSERWQAINSTRGVRRLLPMTSEVPFALPEGFVEGFGERVSAGEFYQKTPEEVAASYVTGEVLRIRGGAFEGFDGEFSHRKRGVLVLLCSLLGAKIPVELVPSLVERPTSPATKTLRASVR